jgi:hypothetical protein
MKKIVIKSKVVIINLVYLFFNKVPKYLIRKIRNFSGGKTNNINNPREKEPLTYPQMSRNIVYRALTDIPLANKEYEIIERNDQLYITLMLIKHEGLIKYLSVKYSTPEFLIRYIFEMQFGFFKRNLKAAPETKKAMFFYEWMHRELFEIKRHYDLIEKLCCTYNLEKENFFDVGSKFCTSLVIALVQGFKMAHGCDFEERIAKYANDIIGLGAKYLPGELVFYPADFLNLDLKDHFYHLIVLINVLEHTSNIETTIRMIKKILHETGVCFIFQGSNKSLPIVLNEPHYNLPLLSILPPELGVKILEKAKFIKSPREYCVVKWANYSQLQKICQKFDLILEINIKENDYYARDKFIPYSQFITYKRKIINETQRKIYPLIELNEKTIIDKVLSDYFSEVEEAIREDSIENKIIYFKKNWDIILKHNHLKK